MLNVHHIVNQTSTEGPGIRCCIWLQGCSIHCEGCFVKDTWSFSERILMTSTDIMDMVLPSEEGITVCGGEPFDQREGLADLVCAASERGLSTIVYTGYTYEALKKMQNDYVEEVLSHTDILIDGSFNSSLHSTVIPLVGSTNQRLLFLTRRYSMADIQKNKLELRIRKNGTISINGMAEYGLIRRLTMKQL